MRTRITGALRAVAVLLTVLAVMAAAPGAAHAAENIYAQWIEGVGERDSKWEVPVVFLVTLPAILVVTPFWLGSLALDAVTGIGDDDEDE